MFICKIAGKPISNAFLFLKCWYARVNTNAGSSKELEEEDFPLTYDGIILYGDIAPKYEEAIKMVKSLEYNNSYFIIVGTSFYTGISEQLYRIARQRHAKIFIINDSASERIPMICKSLCQ